MNSGFPAVRIGLDSLRSGAVEWSGGLPDPGEAWGMTDLEFVGSPGLEYRAELGGHGGVRVRGRLRAELQLTCRRCLEALSWPLEIEFDYRFDPSVAESEEEDGVFALDAESGVVELTRLLREELVLAVPEFPVCSEACRGLCPTCGANRNESECVCRPVEGDPRWDVLRTLVSDGQQAGAADRGRDNEVNEA
jgi:uncharacterized protein